MPQITIRPLTPDRWHGFELVMGPNGGWCAYRRVPRKDDVAGSGARGKPTRRNPRRSSAGASPRHSKSSASAPLQIRQRPRGRLADHRPQPAQAEPLYIMPGFEEFEGKLGKHSTGKGAPLHQALGGYRHGTLKEILTQSIAKMKRK